MKLPWRAKPRVPCERAYKILSETAVKSDPAFCLGPTIEKTKSGPVANFEVPNKYQYQLVGKSFTCCQGAADTLS